MIDSLVAAFQGDLYDVRVENDRLRAALERIAAPARPDGTYNLSREACERIAWEALGLIA